MFYRERLKRQLEYRKITPYRLAKECDVSDTTITNILNGKKLPKIETLTKICDYLEMPISQFFNDECEPVTITNEQLDILDCWKKLSTEQKTIWENLINAIVMS